MMSLAAVVSSSTRCVWRSGWSSSAGRAAMKRCVRGHASGGGENAKPTKRLNDVWRLLLLAKSERTKLVGAVGLLVVSSGVTMTVPFALGKVIDIIYGIDQIKTVDKMRQESSSTHERKRQRLSLNLNNFCLMLSGVFTVGALANFGRVYLMQLVSQTVAARLRSSVFSSITRQEIAFFDRNKTGELINRLSADTLIVSQAISQHISDGLRHTFMTVMGVSMMFFMSPQLALVSLGVVPPVAAWGVFMGRKVKLTSRNVQDALATGSQVAEERISNIRTVRAFAMEERENLRYAQEMSNVLAMGKKNALVQAQFYGLTGLSGNMIVLTVLYYGGLLVTSDVITVGNLTSFILYAAYVGIGFNGMSSFYAEMMKALGASSRLWEITDRVPDIPLGDGKAAAAAAHLQGSICFENVTFNYPSRPDLPIFKGLNLEIAPNKVTAVVGQSGSGKSTLEALLLRLYDPESGRITVDGQPLKDLDSSWLRRQIGTVMQEPVLFSTSIRDNISYGAPDPDLATMKAVEKAAKEANAHDFIVKFPDGYDTLVGERGIMLSGGQKQRVAIARAIIKDPRILILDEATSALDLASEHQVKVALDQVMKRRSVIMIAHRLSTIQNADWIVVLANGIVVEQGTYRELLNKGNGHFRGLARM